MPRNSKGQFTSNTNNGFSIPLPGFFGIYKILFIAILIFPWYVIISNKNISNTLFQYLLGNNFQKECVCEKCPDKCPIYKCNCGE